MRASIVPAPAPDRPPAGSGARRRSGAASSRTSRGSRRCSGAGRPRTAGRRMCAAPRPVPASNRVRIEALGIVPEAAGGGGSRNGLRKHVRAGGTVVAAEPVGPDRAPASASRPADTGASTRAITCRRVRQALEVRVGSPADVAATRACSSCTRCLGFRVPRQQPPGPVERARGRLVPGDHQRQHFVEQFAFAHGSPRVRIAMLPSACCMKSKCRRAGGAPALPDESRARACRAGGTRRRSAGRASIAA